MPSFVGESKVHERMERYRRATTQEVRDALSSPDSVVLDARHNCAFIGWPLDGISRGGHIAGATDFSAAWLAPLQAGPHPTGTDAATLLRSKGITPRTSVIVYDAGGAEATAVASFLVSHGIIDVSIYDVRGWASDAGLPLVAYPNHRLLAPAAHVHGLLGAETAIFECAWGGPGDEFLGGHIPGAVPLDTDDIESGPYWNRASDDRLRECMHRHGVGPETPVVLYCRGRSSMAAYRVWALMAYLGVRDVCVLNGGLAAWNDAGFPLQRGAAVLPQRVVGRFEAPARPHYLIDLPQAEEILARPDSASLVDIRSWDEHIGATPGYEDVSLAGRPAGARWGGDIPGDNTNPDGTMRHFEEIVCAWASRGIDLSHQLAFFCGTGWRASEMLAYSVVAGLSDISVYDGGWYEWVDSGRPIAAGLQEACL